MTKTNSMILQTAILYKVPNQYLAAGTYSVQFRFTLPEKLPSSMFYKLFDDQKNPFARVKYSLTASLEGTDCGKVKY